MCIRDRVRFEIDQKHLADGVKGIAGDLRWNDWTPPEWFKELEKNDPESAYRVSVMVMLNEGANWVNKVGPNLDKILASEMFFAFDNEKFTKLFNHDFKLVTSKMLHDLCEPYTDQNGRTCMRYKEVRSDKGGNDIDSEVMKKLVGIKDYKEEMAKFLAKQGGREEPNFMDRMNAYTAWNMFYMFGDSSLADRMRVLPTYGKVIND